jgi:hypothetical protein
VGVAVSTQIHPAEAISAHKQAYYVQNVIMQNGKNVLDFHREIKKTDIKYTKGAPAGSIKTTIP